MTLGGLAYKKVVAFKRLVFLQRVRMAVNCIWRGRKRKISVSWELTGVTI